MKGITLAAVVTASIVLGSILTLFAFSNIYHVSTMNSDIAMTDECREYQEEHGGMHQTGTHHWGMNHWMDDDCHGYHHDHDGEETHEDCHEYAEDHEHYHEMFEECSEHHGENEDGHHMMHDD